VLPNLSLRQFYLQLNLAEFSNLAPMCGRYAISKQPAELIEEFEISAGHIGKALPAD
jgi:hypothetical protein